MNLFHFSLAALANHLWQSTLFAGAMWVLTLALRKNAARVRHGVWMAASLKFVVPFALLVSFGSHFGWRTAPAIAQAPAAFVVEEIGQPFERSGTVAETDVPKAEPGTLGSLAPAKISMRAWIVERLPEILVAMWLCGFVAGVALWMRWLWRMRGLRRMATPLALDLPVRVLSSRVQMEPCVFGVFRPVLLLPEGIAEQLTAAELDAVIAHECCHIRRRDNLTAALHLLVETIFWFYPALRWIRVRLLEERERACDEAVLQRGSVPEQYAEGILKVCRFYLAAQPEVAAGVMGFNLSKRIEVIVNYRETEKLSAGKKMLVGAFGLMAVGVPVMFGQMHAAASVLRPAKAMLSASMPSPVRTMMADAAQGAMAMAKPVAEQRNNSNVAAQSMPTNWAILQRLNSSVPKTQQAAAVLQLDGKRVSLPGFMVPLEDNLKTVDEFLLVPYDGASIHTPAPPPNQMVYVKLSGRIPVDAAAPILVTGQLRINAVLSPYGDVSYDMSDASVRPYAEHFGAQMQVTETPTFDVASVKQSKETKPSSNVPLGSGGAFAPSHGILDAKNFPLLTYLVFAYKLTDYQQEAIESTAPEWVINDRYSIEARTEKLDATKDELRLMMRLLLAERFKLAVHSEKRQVRVFALVMAKAGALGTKFQQHPAGAICSDPYQKSTSADGKPIELPLQPEKGGFPAVCNGILGLPASAQDRYSFGAANVPTSLIASALSSWGNLGRPVIDQTGLTGTYDFVMDYTPDPRPSYATIDSGGPGFQQALKEQLGLKLEAQRSPVDFLVIDHVERPSAN